MSVIAPPLEDLIVYPDSDGQPMAENTVQYEWIVRIKGNLDAVFRDRPDVFVAGDNLIYPVKGRNDIRAAPDVYVAFGRPKGHRGSYKVWAEGNIFPQVIFEVISPGNSEREMQKKRLFYERYGADEFYIIDPDYTTLEAWLRDGDHLVPARVREEFVSPRLGIRFVITDRDLVIYGPDGTRFLSFQETHDLAHRADGERARGDRLAAKLRSLGIDPDAV